MFAQGVSVTIDLEESFISYDGKHPAHNWTGISKEIKGSFIFDKDDPILSSVDLYVPAFSSVSYTHLTLPTIYSV